MTRRTIVGFVAAFVAKKFPSDSDDFPSEAEEFRQKLRELRDIVRDIQAKYDRHHHP